MLYMYINMCYDSYSLQFIQHTNVCYICILTCVMIHILASSIPTYAIYMYNMCNNTYSCFQHTNTDGPPAIGSQIYSSASGPIVRYKILSPSCAFCCDTRVCVLMNVFVCNSQLQHASVCWYISGIRILDLDAVMSLKLQLGWSSIHCQQMDTGIVGFSCSQKWGIV